MNDLFGYKYKIEFIGSEDVYDKLVAVLEEIAPNVGFKISVEKELICMFEPIKEIKEK